MPLGVRMYTCLGFIFKISFTAGGYFGSIRKPQALLWNAMLLGWKKVS